MGVVRDGPMPPKLRGCASGLGVRREGERSRGDSQICALNSRRNGCPLPVVERTWGERRTGSGASFELLSLSCLLYMLMDTCSSLLL